MMEFTKNNNPVFPVYDNDFDWTAFSKGPIPILFDEFVYRKMSNNDFKKTFYNHKVIDCHGQEYVVSNIKKLSWWRFLLPGFKKGILIFEKTNITYSLEEIKEIIVNKIDANVDDKSIRHDWVNEINKTKTIENLFLASG